MKKILIGTVITVILAGAFAYYYFNHTRDGLKSKLYRIYGEMSFVDLTGKLRGVTRDEFMNYISSLTLSQMQNFDIQKYKTYVLLN